MKRELIAQAERARTEPEVRISDVSGFKSPLLYLIYIRFRDKLIQINANHRKEMQTTQLAKGLHGPCMA
jgi:hypothetical protein